MANNGKRNSEDATAFPILTEEVNFPNEAGRSGLTAGTAPLSQKVDLTLREILGWRPRNNDPRGFLASLNQAFEVKDVEGHTEWKWRPRTYAAEADLGAITGAQASLYSRARAALDQSLPLLDGLVPLRADFDPQDIEAARSIVNSSLTELVYELGIEGGPRLARVDGYFLDLLGPIADPTGASVLTDPEQVGGQLAALRDGFGLIGAQVNTVDEEQNLTNFFILVDTVNSLWLTWRSQRDAFDHRKDGRSFLGTQLVLLSRNLAVVAESVEETYFAMDSVFLGPAERQITRLELQTGEVVFLGELLDWVYRFATEEGPRLLREGGKDGVIQAFRPTVARLTRLVSGALDVSRGGASDQTRGFHTARVQRALEELKTNLEATQINAGEISRFPGPEITLVHRMPFDATHTLLTVNGRNFRQGATLRLASLVKPDGTTDPLVFELAQSNVTFVSSSELKAILEDAAILTFFASHRKNDGSLNLTVIVVNPDGQAAGTQGLSISGQVQAVIQSQPVIEQIQPNIVSVQEPEKLENFELIITGKNFQKGATLALKINSDVVGPRSIHVKPPNTINAIFGLEHKAAEMARAKFIAVVVTNPDGGEVESTSAQGLTVQGKAPKQ